MQPVVQDCDAWTPAKRGRGTRRLGMIGLALVIAAAILFAISRFVGSSAASNISRLESPAEITASAETAREMLGDLNRAWAGIFAATGRRYLPATLVTFDGTTRSRCAFAVAQTGVFYCAVDRSLQVDLSLLAGLRREFGEDGDHAAYYLLAQAMGRHVQREIGALSTAAMERRGADSRQAGLVQQRLEQQADCHAGLAASHIPALRAGWDGAATPPLLTALATQAARQASRFQGAVWPNPVSAATLDDRAAWFRRGLGERHMAACDGTESVALLR